jgi:hypothetical protein
MAFRIFRVDLATSQGLTRGPRARSADVTGRFSVTGNTAFAFMSFSRHTVYSKTWTLFARILCYLSPFMPEIRKVFRDCFSVPWSIIVERVDDFGRVCCPHCGEWNSIQRSTYYKYHYLGRCLKGSNDDSDEHQAKGWYTAPSNNNNFFLCPPASISSLKHLHLIVEL